jgi:hypothetical protein
MPNIFDDFLKQGTPNLVPTGTSNIFDTPSNLTVKTGTVVGKKRDLQTLDGLQELAKEKGVGAEAQKITSEVRAGEKPKEIFSGGFISDVFDALSVGQYAIAGAAEGKTLKDAIKTKSSWTDPELLGRYGTVGTIAGVVADIFADPINLIPVFGWGTKALDGIKQGVKLAEEVKFAKPVFDALGRGFIYRFGQSPVYAKMAEDTFKAIVVGQQTALEIARPITKLTSKEQIKIGQWLKGEIPTLDEKLLRLANQARNEFKKLGQEAVDVGLLDSDTYFANVNKYLPRLYEKHELPPAFQKYLADIKPQRADLSRFMKREDIPEEIRKGMGEILEAGYPTAKGLAQTRQAVEMTKFFGQTAKTFGKNVFEEGMKKLPETKRLGLLSGKYVPEPIFKDIEEMIRQKSGLEKALGRAVGTWKFGKVVLNPATHARNILSNFILNDFEGLSPARLDVYAKAAKSLLTKDALYKEAKVAGLGLDTFAAQEIKGLMLPAKGIGIKVQAIADKISSIYQGEEEFAKMAQFIFQKGKGLSSEEAFKIAERATFNYAQVTPLIRKLRTSVFGFPFITFTAKATPQVVKTLITKPGKISKIGKIARGVESKADQKELAEERAVEPDYIRDGFFVKLPGKDKYGRSGYFDLTYIIPFGDLVSGQFLTPQVNPETKQKEGILQTILRQQPLFNAVAEIGANKDFFGEPIIKPTSTEPEEQGLDIFKYIARFYGPPSLFDFPFRLAQSAEFEKQTPTEQQMGELGVRQTKTVAQEAMRGLLGIKVQPINQQLQATMADSDKRKALENFLNASGITAQSTRTFIPKEQKTLTPEEEARRKATEMILKAK